MARLPERGTLEYNERIEQMRQRHLRGPRLRYRLLVLAFVFATMVLPGLYFVVRAFCHDALPAERLGGALFGAIFLLIPARVLQITIKRRRQTGVWTMKPTPEERLERAKKWSIQMDAAPKGLARWASLASDLVLFPVYGFLIWTKLKPNHPALDMWDWVLIAAFSLWLGQACWSLSRKSKRRTATA